MSDAYSVGFKDGAAAGYKLAIEDMKLDKKPQIMKKYEGDHASLLARHNALRKAAATLCATIDNCEVCANEPAISCYLRARDIVECLLNETINGNNL